MTPDSPIVSVLMPVYNAERYLAEAVDSILAQTFSDFEFIIVDDGSTDGSLAILQKYAALDSRIRLVSRPNTGLVGALNEMRALARGEFIARMDADDVATFDRFKLQVAFLRTNPNVIALGGAFIVIDEDGTELISSRPPEHNHELQELLLSGNTALCHPTVMMRKVELDMVGGYRADSWPTEDLDLWLRLGERGELANLPQIVLRYREHSKSVSSQNQERQLESARRSANEAADRRGLLRRDLNLQIFRPV